MGKVVWLAAQSIMFFPPQQRLARVAVYSQGVGGLLIMEIKKESDVWKNQLVDADFFW